MTPTPIQNGTYPAYPGLFSSVHIASHHPTTPSMPSLIQRTTPRNDILRKHGVIPQKPPSPTPMIEEAMLETRRLMHENRLEGKDLDELAELEDDEDEEFLEQYR